MPILHLSQLIGVAAGLELRAQVQAPRRLGRAGHREARRRRRAKGCLVPEWREGRNGRSRCRIASLPRSALAARRSPAWGWFEAGWLRTRVARGRARGVPPELDGLRIAHLSDFHLGVPRAASAPSRTPSPGWSPAPARSRLRHRRPRLAPRGMPLLERLLGEARAVLRRAREPRLRRQPRPVLAARRSGGDRRARGRVLLDDERVEVELRGRRVQLVGVDPQTYAARARSRAARRPRRRPPRPPLPLPGDRAHGSTARSTSSSPGTPRGADRRPAPGREAPPRAPPRARRRGRLPLRARRCSTSRRASERRSSRSGSSPGRR